MKKLASCLLVLASLAAAPAFAQLKLTITSGVTDPIPIAVVPFARAVPADGGIDVAAIVQRDLESSGRFKAMARTDMINTPTTAAEVEAAAWKQMRNDYVVVGRVSAVPGGQLAVEAELVNVLNGQMLPLNKRWTVVPANLRNAAHRVADAVYERIIGQRGAFATRIAYVSVDGQPPKQRYQLIVADADGENPHVILERDRPLMSPAWSPDGKMLAYVSFESKTSAVYVQDVATTQRSRVSARAGINGAPTWSPDGRKLALTLGGSGGNLDVYLLDLATQQLKRLTDDPGIDTEASFSPDGATVYFTSDRSGSPQVYRVPVTLAERPKRVTFTGTYNARPRVSPDGKQLAVLTLDGGSYRIGLQDLASGTMTVLSKGQQDESPSFAPNGAMVILAGRQGGRGVLQTVSIDGQTSARLNADAGEVREPVWGPFLP
ncbi:MAG TPA: Tol-Pal system beta propeller repeat protein TolB [Steroidobacteraceae bacterium]|nr:Tol-Pal system beta propeller repeat protein TolB [Steroidobacteraceae bacterium]